MINLPISSKPQSSSDASNALQANTAVGTQIGNTQPAEPFAFLLAQHIDETDLASLLDAAQTALTTKGGAADTNQTLNDTQDVVATPDIQGEPANILAAILQQLPADNRGQENDGPLSAQTLNPIHLHNTGNTKVAITDLPETGYEKPGSNPKDALIIQLPNLDALPSDTIKRVELFSGLAQPSQNTAQAIASSAILASTPATPAHNMPAGNTQPVIATPLGSNGWADEFSQKISWISTQQNHVAELRLNPPNLGPLDVVLKISDNQATALFTSPHGAVRDAVENALPKLRELLADNGITLGNTTISDQPPRDRHMDGFKNPDSGAAAQHETSGIASGSADLSAVESQTAMVRRHNGMVDTFA